MWRFPKTLLWPMYGFAFDRMDLSNWPINILHDLMTEPTYYIPELAGAIILICFAVILIYKKRVLAFLKYGQSI